MSLISLCLIVGNVEKYIERCLTSFAPIADEICIVRAIGNQEPDRTIEIARNVILEIHHKRAQALGDSQPYPQFKWSEYKNADGHEDWPHIDDFGAARQQSFDLATGKWIFWADTDDVLQSGAELVRELAEQASRDGGIDCFIFPYEIFGQHVTVPRERMVKRAAGKWTNPVHEFFKFHQTVDGYRDDRVVVRHLPHLNKHGSVERNLRIIKGIPENEMTPGMRYQLHCELLGAGRKHEAFIAAKEALTSGGLGKPETYQLLIHLATFSTDPHTIESYLIAAYQTDPCRREALGLLAGHMIDYGQPAKSIAFARQMLATEPPVEESWNDRRSAYSWLGIEIMQQALRANDRFDEAERLRKGLLAQAGGAKISLIHATRGRPKRAAIARKLWLDLAEDPASIEHIFVFDDDDRESDPLSRMHHIVIPSGGGCVAAWNIGAAMTEGKVLIQMSDDWLPPPRWDKLILERIGDLEQPRVLAISDGKRTDQLLCMAIMTRAYFMQDWFMFHPRFTGVYSDNWLTLEAYRRQVVIEAKDIVFEHDHPMFKCGMRNADCGIKGTDSEFRIPNSEFDETYLKQNAPERYAEGKKLYDELLAGHDWSMVHGWFNFWPFYQRIAQKLKDGDVVAEIGVFLGRSIIFLAQECRRLGKNVRFIAVDTFEGEKDQPAHVETVAAHGGNIRLAFEENLKRCGVEDMIDILEGDSVEQAANVVDATLDFCFIDAAHDYESVQRDIAAWLPKVKQGGTLAGHDAQYEPVSRAVIEMLPEALVGIPIWTYLNDAGQPPDIRLHSGAGHRRPQHQQLEKNVLVGGSP